MTWVVIAQFVCVFLSTYRLAFEDRLWNRFAFAFGSIALALMGTQRYFAQQGLEAGLIIHRKWLVFMITGFWLAASLCWVGHAVHTIRLRRRAQIPRARPPRARSYLWPVGVVVLGCLLACVPPEWELWDGKQAPKLTWEQARVAMLQGPNREAALVVFGNYYITSEADLARIAQEPGRMGSLARKLLDYPRKKYQ